MSLRSPDHMTKLCSAVRRGTDAYRRLLLYIAFDIPVSTHRVGIAVSLYFTLLALTDKRRRLRSTVMVYSKESGRRSSPLTMRKHTKSAPAVATVAIPPLALLALRRPRRPSPLLTPGPYRIAGAAVVVKRNLLARITTLNHRGTKSLGFYPLTCRIRPRLRQPPCRPLARPP